MTQWYYSDYDRNRHGPVRAEDLAMLHANGQLAPETLVWREGMSEWRPWREVMAEVVGGHAAPAPSRASFALVEDEPAPAPEPARASADPGGRNPYEVVQPAPRAHAAPADAGRNPYEVVERSPYAPPRAHVGGASTVVRDGHVVYVGFLKRFAASILDNFVTGIASYALLIPLVLLGGRCKIPAVNIAESGTVPCVLVSIRAAENHGGIVLMAGGTPDASDADAGPPDRKALRSAFHGMTACKIDHIKITEGDIHAHGKNLFQIHRGLSPVPYLQCSGDDVGLFKDAVEKLYPHV